MTWLTSDYGSMVRVRRATLLATSDITPRGLAPRSTTWPAVAAPLTTKYLKLIKAL